MHIVSNVEGQLDAKYDALDALAAGFPAGTVSGAPKVRAMEIIDELEKEKRGLYAGAVGYFSAAGELDSCIVLRTALVKDGMMYVQAGAGIVADFEPEVRAAGMRRQGQGAVPRRRGGQAVCQRGTTRTVAMLVCERRATPIECGSNMNDHSTTTHRNGSTTACASSPGNSLDPNTAQTPGMDRKAAINLRASARRRSGPGR